MHRFQHVTLVVMVALGIALTFTWRVVSGGEASQRSAQDTLTRADRAFGASQRLLQREQFAAAEALAHGVLVAHLGTITAHQDALFELQGELDRAVPSAPPDRPEDHATEREALVAKHPELLEGITTDLIARLERYLGDAAWHGRTRAEVTADVRKDLLHCAALGARPCLQTFSYAALHDSVESLRAKRAQGVAAYAPDIALVVDAHGNGLADADAPSWPDAKAFASYVPALTEALTSGALVRDVARLPGREGWYLLAAAPIREGREARGAVLVASRLDVERARADGAYVGFDVAWVVGGDIVASTLGAVDEAAIGVELVQGGEPSRHQVLLSERFQLAVVPLTGYVSAADVRVVLIDRPQAASTATTLTWGWLVTLMLVALAITLLVVTNRRAQREADQSADALAAIRGPHETWSVTTSATPRPTPQPPQAPQIGTQNKRP